MRSASGTFGTIPLFVDHRNGQRATVLGGNAETQYTLQYTVTV